MVSASVVTPLRPIVTRSASGSRQQNAAPHPHPAAGAGGQPRRCLPPNVLKKSCSLSKYQFLVPHELKAVQKMKEQFEDIMLLSDRKCNTRLFHRKWNTGELSVPDRVMLVEAELDLATTMLGLPAAPTFAETRLRPLAFLAQAREDLRGCVAREAPSHQPSGKLRHWLQKLQTAKERESDGCLEASTILHLFQVLNDLRCAAPREHCT
ncbi:LOW QUALITY PROTEIN: interferon lambda-3-like [Tyto alba]|uniref:LOW QUALITY PROTEIN: interferon lambda-3-like n=1 Tax=Tyto alba TaxID=56313 RepID=UPI001C67A2D3|nr:LOW QUALITY PROTEIN: interferon lambda-3-like [Tyto alba]